MTAPASGKSTPPRFFPAAIAIGAAIGVSIGVSLHNVAVGVAIGVAMVFVFNVAFRNRKS